MANKPPPDPLADLEPNDQVSRPCIAPNIFTDEECDRIIKLSDALPEIEGTIGFGDNSRVEATIRESSLKCLTLEPDSKWVFQRVHNAISEVNKLFKYDIYGFNVIQVARYGAGDHYNTWHNDLGRGQTSLRKLSISVQLSAPEDYDGGKLEFQGVKDEAQQSKERGTTIVFPTYLTHRVTPVTRGVRWSLVVWVKGPPFR